ncbi:MAG TPA: peptidoglycan DD-metalloendopeptidase family protein [Anaerolineales bacterium]|nr:peptidoglycan DD-metalloendopeptidase family protein [Anaerolineales bacterium]
MEPRRRRITSRLSLWAPAIVAIAGLLSAAWGIWANVRAEREAPTWSEPEANAPAAPLDIDLPAFEASAKGALVSRIVEPRTEIRQRARVEVLRYTVQEGDSVFGIADRFAIEPETVLWGNFETLEDDPHLLRPGQELNILPVDGTYYEWQAGDSLTSVADFFGAQVSDIVDWPGNNLDPDNLSIEPGTWLIVPGGKRAFRTWIVPTIARGQAGVGAAFGPGGCTGDYSGGAFGSGGFIWPSGNHYVSGNDYWSGHLAIDIAAGTGDTVWAADAGVIVFAGWSTVGYGNMVMIDHGNGWQTLYAHLNSVRVACGQSVGQGDSLGSAGSTGNSSGPHLHFETRFEGGFVNPWYVLP